MIRNIMAIEELKIELKVRLTEDVVTNVSFVQDDPEPIKEEPFT